MKFDLLNNLEQNISSNNSNNFIESFINELKSYLDNSLNPLYTLDRFEDFLMVLM